MLATLAILRRIRRQRSPTRHENAAIPEGFLLLDIPSSRGTIIVSHDGFHPAPEDSALFSDSRTMQQLLGHASVETTTIDTHVRNRGRCPVRSPLDQVQRLPG
jgi:hypothetical protein